MTWTLIPNRHSHSAYAGKQGEGLFVRKCNSYQIYVSKELAEELGEYLTVHRSGHKFRLCRASQDDDGARVISGIKAATVRKFCCKQLHDELDDGRVYVEERGEGIFEL